MKKQYLLFMAIMNFVACPLEEGVGPFDRFLHPLLQGQDGRLYLSGIPTPQQDHQVHHDEMEVFIKDFFGESPPRTRILMTWKAGCFVMQFIRDIGDTYFFIPSNPRLFVGEPIARTYVKDNMFKDPEYNRDYIRIVSSIPFEAIDNFFKRHLSFIESQYFIVSAQFNNGANLDGVLADIYFQTKIPDHPKQQCIHRIYCDLLKLPRNRPYQNFPYFEKGILPSAIQIRLEDANEFYLTPNEGIDYIKDPQQNPFVANIHSTYTQILEIWKNTLSRRGICPSNDYVEFIDSLNKPGMSYTQILHQLASDHDDWMGLTDEEQTDIWISYHCKLINLATSPLVHPDCLVHPLRSATKETNMGLVDFIETNCNLKLLCSFFRIPYIPDVGMVFEEKGFVGMIRDFNQQGRVWYSYFGFDYMPGHGMFAQDGSVIIPSGFDYQAYHCINPTNIDSISKNFQELIGYLANDGTIKWKVKFLPVALSKTAENWKKTLRDLSNNKIQDLTNRLLITGQALGLNPDMNDSENVPAADFDAVTGPVYTHKTLKKLKGDLNNIKLLVRVNPNGELEIRANVPQAPEEPIVAPAPVVQQNAVAAPAVVKPMMPQLEEIHSLNIPLPPLGSLKWTGNNTVKQQSGGHVHELSNFMNGTLIPNKFKAVSIQLSIENMREVLDILKKCKQNGHFLYAVLPNHATKGDRFFVGRDIQGLYAGCIRKGKLYLEE